MPVTPILTAEYVFRNALADAFAALLTAYVDSAGRAKCYYKRADQVDANRNAVTLPYLIYQPQTDIAPIYWVNGVDAEALFTIRALAANQSAAETLLGVAIPGVNTLSMTGYTFSAKYDRTPNIPPSDNTWAAAHIYRITVHAT